MGFIYIKNQDSDKESISKIGRLIANEKFKALKAAGVEPEKIAEVLHWPLNIVNMRLQQK